MRVDRFLRDFDFSRPVLVSHDKDLIAQIRTVLKLRVGSLISLTDGEGKEGDALLKSISAREAVFEMEGPVHTVSRRTTCRLYCALIKHDRFEYVVQKATEIGISEIVPVITQRTVKRHARTERLITIAREAVEQSGQAWMPLMREPIILLSALKEVESQGGAGVFCDVGGENIFSVMDSLNGQNISLFIGPEGGWDNEERSAAHAANCRFASLGDTVLRADTAAVAAAFTACNYHRK
ncbi:16S rRNA (uracil(1498)-N(3))-methyltransferase [Candidatus Uhrbacteria bacterium]|nr:16S rRNA (uracil(1498)-N(3))-methyltransferase [Candidatus Uhrbacteria bacterium]